MRIEADRVYFYGTHIDEAEAPFEAYRKLAMDALDCVQLDLPEKGKILLKPNATVLYDADKRIVTHPGFLGGILDSLNARGVAFDRMVVADGQSGERPEQGFTWEGAGYRGAMDSRGVALKCLNGEEKKFVPVPGGVVFDTYPIYKDVTDCEFLFNVPLAKCHNLGCTTLTIKNLMGILGRPERHLCNVQEVDKPFGADLWRLTDSGLSLFEDRFYHKLCDVVHALRSLEIPQLCMVDGLVGRDGTAFNEGENAPLGWTLMGTNEVHVDAVGTYLMGLDPMETPYLRVATERGLGTSDVGEIDIVDLQSGNLMDFKELESKRSKKVLMPISRYEDGYYDRFRADGSVVPWRIDEVNKKRVEDGLDPISVR
jgi:uncharacterized protein (DUF362 family)